MKISLLRAFKTIRRIVSTTVTIPCFKWICVHNAIIRRDEYHTKDANKVSGE